MSKSDPLTLKCCYCGVEQKFADQGQAIENWSIEEDGKGVVFALCPKDARNQIAMDQRTALIMGKPIPEKGADEDVAEKKDKGEKGGVAQKEGIETKGVKMRARFKLEAIDVEVAGLTIAGDPTIKSIDLNSKPDYVIGAQYHVNLK